MKGVPTIIERFAKSKETVDTIYLFFLQGANYLIPVITTPYLMKVLGASGYGLIGFSFSLILYFTLFVDFGFNMSATKRIASDPSKLNVIFTSVFVAKTLLLSIALLFIPIIINIDNIAEYKYAVLSFIPLLIGNTYTFFWLFQGVGKVRVISILNTVSKVMILPLTFVFVRQPEDIYIAILIQSMVFVGSCLISNIYIVKNKVVRFAKVTLSDVKAEFEEGYPLFLSSAATSLYTQLFTIILGFTATSSVVGCYSACERIVRTLFQTFYTPISLSFFPRLSSLAAVSRTDALALFSKLRHIISLFMLFIILAIFVSADMIADFLGKDYQDMNTIIRMMSVALIAIALGAYYGQMGLVALGDSKSKKDFSKVYFIVAPISLGVMYALSSIWGIYGTTFSLICTEFSVSILMFVYYKRNNKRLNTYVKN